MAPGSRGESAVTAPPFFPSAGRGTMQFWGKRQGPAVYRQLACLCLPHAFFPFKPHLIASLRYSSESVQSLEHFCCHAWIPPASLMLPLIFRDWRSELCIKRHTLCMCIYTMSIHSIAPYTLYVYTHHVYTLDIPSI